MAVNASLTRSAFGALNRVVRPVLATGFGNPLPLGPGVAVVETIGRRTGQPRRVPLATVRLGDRLVVATLRPSSNWFANLEATATARVQLAGSFGDVTAATYRGVLNVAVLDRQHGEASSGHHPDVPGSPL